MPYIKQEQRPAVFERGPQNAGELNYLFTMVLQQYIEAKGNSYQTFNDILGALEGAKLEFVRRIVSPYENGKIELNGDIYNG